MSQPPLSRPPAGDEKFYRELGEAVDRRVMRGMQINNVGFNGSTRFVNAMLTVIALLMVAAVSGMWGMYGKVESLGVQVKDLSATVDLIVAGKLRP
jgi:hypothetical protein